MAVGFLTMPVLVVFVMDVPMVVLQRLVSVLVLVPFSEVQPHADPHQRRGDEKIDREVIAQNKNGNECSNERSQREIGACSRGAYVPQRQDKKDEAYPITEKTHHGSRQHGENIR